MKLEGHCQTTAMGIMPHTDIERALNLALSLDIPYWPQLPKVSFYEDMYAQVSEHFPGIIIDTEKREISLSSERFYEELDELFNHWEDEEYFKLTSQYSAVFHKFLEQDLSSYSYIRGQSIGPISYGLKIVDENKRSIAYNEEIRQILFEFMAKKLQAQYNELKAKHDGAFVWVDEPALELLFMAFTGYNDDKAFQDYQYFLEQFPGPKGVHLCGNPDWSFLLQLELDVLSVDTLAWGHNFTRYTEELQSFLQRGGIISWGITPTLTEEFEAENLESMYQKINNMWSFLMDKGISREQLFAQSWLAPARCCLINADGEQTVEKSFKLLRHVSARIKDEMKGS